MLYKSSHAVYYSWKINPIHGILDSIQVYDMQHENVMKGILEKLCDINCGNKIKKKSLFAGMEV